MTSEDQVHYIGDPDERAREKERQHVEAARSQKASLNRIAARLREGADLTDAERRFAAHAIDSLAARIALIPRKAPGPRRKVEPGEAAMMVAFLMVEEGMDRTPAEEKVAATYGADRASVRDAIRDRFDAALQFARLSRGNDEPVSP